MSQFDEYVARVTERLDLSRADKDEIRREALAHLEDEAGRLVAEGKDRNEAEALSIEAFGKDDVVAALVSRALEKRQKRHRRLRRVLAVAGASLLVVFVIGLGAWFSVFDDAVSGASFVEKMPDYLFPVLYLGAWVWGLAILAAVAYRLSSVRKGRFMLAVAVVLAAFIAAFILFEVTAMRSNFGSIRGDESAFELAVDRFVMQAWLTVIPTCLVAGVVLVLGRGRIQGAWLPALTVVAGLLSADLRVAMYTGCRWLTPYKWPKLASVGLTALVFVMLIVFLARSIGVPRDREAETSGALPAGETAAR